MEAIDSVLPNWLIIAIYFIFILGVGFYLKYFIKTEDDIFTAESQNSFWLIGLSLITINLGALELIGMMGSTVKYGMYVAHFFWIGAIPAMLFLGIFIIPFFYNNKIESITDYFKHRYDEKTRILNNVAFATTTLLVSGINLYATALILHTLLGWNWNISIFIGIAIAAIYIALRNFISAIFIEFVLFFLIWFGLLLISIMGIIDMGGINNIFHHIPEAYSRLWSNSVNPAQNAMMVNWIGIVLGLGFVLSFGYWTSDFLVMRRAYSAKDIHSAQMTPIFASFLKMALPFIVVLAGLIVLSLSRNSATNFNLLHESGRINYDSAVPLLIARYYPKSLVGLGVAALLAGFTAVQVWNIKIFDIVWTNDIYHSLNKKASKENLNMMRKIATLSGILITVAAAYWAKSFPSIMDYMQAIFSWVNAPLLAIILLGIFIKWITPTAAFCGLLIGISSSFGLFLAEKFNWIPISMITLSNVSSEMAANFWRALWACLICLIVTIIVSSFTKKKPESKLMGFVKGLTTQETISEPVVFYRKPIFWALISLATLIALNVYFW